MVVAVCGRQLVMVFEYVILVTPPPISVAYSRHSFPLSMDIDETCDQNLDL